LSREPSNANLQVGGKYDVYLAGSVRDNTPVTALYFPENRDKGLNMQKRFEIREGRNRPPSTAADVLGSVELPPAEIDPKLRNYYQKLMELREKLLDRRSDLGRLAPVEEANHSVNLADRGTDEYEMGAQFGQFSSDQDAMFEIEQAMRRIADGTYGICEVTGERIPEDRLDAVPWTRFAKEVEANVERELHSHRPKHIF
jgi:RNA polymerase-binding transcription factor DksA